MVLHPLDYGLICVHMCECCALHNLLGLETVMSCQQKSWWAVMFSTRVFTVKPKQENNWKRLTSSVSNHLHSRRHQACDWFNLFLLKLYSSGGSTLSTRVLSSNAHVTAHTSRRTFVCCWLPSFSAAAIFCLLFKDSWRDGGCWETQ